jgi:hypothetical protein
MNSAMLLIDINSFITLWDIPLLLSILIEIADKW